LYTYAIVYKCESNYTNGNYMYRYEYNSSNTYLTEAGVHNDSNRIHLGNGWYWAWATFTTQATASYINPYSFYYRYSTSYDKLSVAKIMLVQGDYTGLHPRYWPDVLTTRSTSDTIADPIGKNSVTANSLTYASNGDISFNGTGNYLTLPASVGTFGTADFTIDCWWKSNGTQSSYTAIIEQGFTGSPSSGAWAFKVSHSSADINFTYCTPTISDNLSSNSPNDGAWHNLVAVRSGTTLTLYKDAVVVKTATLPSGFSFGEGSSVFVGYNPRDGSYLKGYLPSLKIYGRAMGIDEVLQNFNAQRGRYGI
jgi:hypothetical protein